MTDVSTTDLSNEMTDLESWRNVTQGRVVVIKLSAQGQRRHEMVGPDRTFHLTPRERRINQELAANEDLDVFLNGTLQPVRLTDSPDAPELLDNPNHLTDAEARGLFRKDMPTFAERVHAIKNPSALQRLVDLAENDEKVKATVMQLRVLKARLELVQPAAISHVRADVASGEKEAPSGTGIKAVTPK